MAGTEPTLWQLEISHYSEKARWALAYKDVEHRRRSPLPGSHMVVALALTRGRENTFPILRLDGRTIGDSTAIVAAIERRYPDPPLYPADPEQRRRALELEEFFDEELGPYARFLPFHELVNEPELFAEVAADAVPGPLGKVKPMVGLYARTYTSLRFGVRDKGAAQTAREKILAALDRLEGELAASESGYLVGASFGVADLTAAALFYPIVIPPEGPLSTDLPTPPAFESFRDGIRDRPGFAWVEEMFRRHRRPAKPATAGASA